MMPLEFQIVLYLAINSLSLYTLNSAINLFLKPRPHCKASIKALVWALYLIIGTITYIIKMLPAVNLIITFFLVILTMIISCGNIKIKLAVSTFWIFLSLICELFVGYIYGILLKAPLNEIIIDDISKLIGSTISALVVLIIVKVIQLYKKKKENLERFSFFDSLRVGIVPICSILIIHTLKNLSKYNDTNIQWLVVISLLCVVFINIFFYSLFERLRKMERLKYENELLKNQSEYYVELEKHMNSTFEKIRAMKHDLSHHLLYLKASLEEPTEDSLNKVKNKLDLLIGEVLPDNAKIYTENQKINRLLNYKLLSAYKKNIDTEVKISISEDASIDESSLYVILGNAINNAVECFNNSETLDKKLEIRIFDDSNNLFIKITNPYIGNITFKNGLPVTTKRNKMVHGIGLRSIKKLVEDKHGLFKITTLNNIFSLEVLLYDEIKNE